ncbi:MAG: hypothetical protein J0I32_05150 [Sphingobacteriales bacterium]|nr:hypothetical protein [Sphingobacteriales bacterium]OJW04032.1 MAG: hypothetical protein BGO52_18005 [Sphingobacteriales bacterium 44-61]
MKTKITITFFATLFAIAICGMAYTPKEKIRSQQKTDKAVVFANYYYRFTGSPGQEDDESLWELISDVDFNNSTCDEEKNGCVIRTISSAATAPAHPDLVPVSGTGSAMTPVIDNVNVNAAKFKNPL